VRSEGVRLDDAAPVGIECYRSPLTDALSPMVFVGKAPSGPSHVRHFHRFERGDDIVADPARVRNLRVRADPNSLVNAVAEVFGELAEEVAVNLRASPGTSTDSWIFCATATGTAIATTSRVKLAKSERTSGDPA